MDNQMQDFGIQSIAYEQLQGEFQQVLVNLSSDQTLDRFRIQYQKIHKALKHSHDQQKKLLGKCRELSMDIIAGAAKLQSALKFSNDDSHTISYLKAEVAKTYKYLQLSRQHEELSRQRIQKLKGEMKRLHMMMEQNDSITEGQVSSVHQYTIANEELQKEKEILQVSLQSNRGQLAQINVKIGQSEKQKEELKVNYEQLLVRKKTQEQRVKDEEESKKHKKDQLQIIKQQFDRAKVDQTTSKDKRKQLNRQYKDLSRQLYDIEVNIEKQKKILKRHEKQEIIEVKKMEEIKEIKTNLQILLKVKEKELNSLKELVYREKQKHQNLNSTAQAITQEINAITSQREQLQQIRQIIKNGLIQLQTQINDEKKNTSKDRSFIQKLRRDRDVYKKQLQRSQVNNRKIYEEVLNKQKVLKEKANEMFGQKKQIQKLNKMLITLQKQRDTNSFQATSAEAKYFYSRDEVKLRDNFIAEFQKQNMETQAKLKKQQALYDAVTSDRSMVSKKLAEIQQQKVQYLKRCKAVTHQITQLKEQIDTKQSDLVKQHNDHKKKDKKIEDEQKKIGKFEKDISEKEEKIKNYENQVKKLQAIIKQIEYQKQKLEEEYELVVSERDILGTQLIRRSAEADLLYEKIKINQSALSKGEVQYHEKIIQIHTQKEEIASLMNEIKSYKIQNTSIDDLKAQMHNLNRELTQAKLKVKALSEQIEKPINVHRWRKLQATDSNTYELMTKIQSIQKRLIIKTEEVKKKEREYEQRQKQLKSLQQVLKRQPSIQQQKMLPIYEQNLHQKWQQIQSMRQQVQTYEQDISEFTIQLQRLQKQLQTFKKKFYYQKKREQQSKDDKKNQDEYIKVILPDKRFTGGGFNLAI